MVGETVIATVALLSVTASFPLFLRGASIIIDAETVTWEILTRHLRYVGVGLLLTTVPVVSWMVPRLLNQLGGLAALHAVLGLQAYAMLAFALTGIARIFQVKRRADLYRDPDPTLSIDELHENVSDWRRRLLIGVFGYVIFWLLAYVLGVARYALLHLSL
jgi:hypothetical protein